MTTLAIPAPAWLSDGYREHPKLSRQIDEDTLFRFGYVPLVVGEVAWDYADTILNYASMTRAGEIRTQCRAIKELRRYYEQERARYMDRDGRREELRNMEVFQDTLSDYFELVGRHFSKEIMQACPDISAEKRAILCSAYLARIVISAIYKYIAKLTRKIEFRVGHRIGQIIPEHYAKLGSVMEQIAKVYGVLPSYGRVREQCVDELICSIESIDLGLDE